MFDAIGKALNQLFDPRILRVIGISLLLSIVSFVLVLVAVYWALDTFDLSSIGWLEATIDWLGIFAAVYAARWGGRRWPRVRATIEARWVLWAARTGWAGVAAFGGLLLAEDLAALY